MTSKAEIRDYFAKFGKEGGKTRAKNMTPEQRSASARKAVEARWAKIDKTLTKLERKQSARDARLKSLEEKNRTRSKAAKRKSDAVGKNG